MSTDKDRERTMMKLEDAVYEAAEAGMTPDEIKAEVEYTLESLDDA